ncbi:MAG: hypothetical protein GXO25_03170 [Euryarchaeota archaeon]|nr:hypothetical protein [Euryarchaeota archaeon]
MLKYFLIEEYRRHVAMTKKYSLFVFPLYIIFFTAIGAVFIQDVLAIFPYRKFILMNMLSVFIYGFGVGSFEFLGRAVEGFNLSNTYSILPISSKKIYLYSYYRDAIYYTLLFLAPAFAGLLLSSPLSHLTPLQISIFSLSLLLSMFLGYSASYLAFSIYHRSRVGYIAFVLVVFAYLVLSYLSYVPFVVAEFQITKNPVYLAVSVLAIAGMAGVAYMLTPTELYEKRRFRHGKLAQYHRRFKDILFAKELVDVLRGGIIIKSTLTYFLPMLLLFIFVRVLNRVSSRNVYNSLSLTVMLSIFSTVVYSWLTIMDDYRYIAELPLQPWDLIKTHIKIHVLIVSIISVPIIIWLNMGTPEYLPFAFGLFYLNVFYLLTITAYLAGYRVTSMLFDPGVVMKFSVYSVVPGIILTISSINIGLMGTVIIIITAIMMMVLAFISIKRAKKKWKYFD